MADAILARQITEQVTRLRQRQTAPLILELDLTEGIGEGPVTDPLTAIMSRRRARLPDVIEGLRRAREDDRVRALVARVGGGRIGLARMQELREAISEFRESGKLTVAWSETFGEFTHGNVPYYLATAFDRIYLQPSGSVGLTGEPRYLGVVPCQSPMNAMSTIEAPRVAITTTCTERPRSGA